MAKTQNRNAKQPATQQWRLAFFWNQSGRSLIHRLLGVVVFILVILTLAVWLRIMTVSGVGWFHDPVLLGHILLAMIGLYLLTAKGGARFERTVFWVFIAILLFNLFWAASEKAFPDQAIYHLALWPQLVLTSVVLLFHPQTARLLLRVRSDAFEVNNQLEQEGRQGTDSPIRLLPKLSNFRSGARIFRWLERWVKEDGRTHVCLFFVILLLGISLRFIGLGHLSPTGDEYRHLLAADHYLKDGFFEYVFSTFTTYLVIFVKQFIATDSMFALRFPFALAGSISIILMYLWTRKINKTAALISAYLFAVLPLAVGLARYIRSYELDLMFLLGLLLLTQAKVFQRPIFRYILALGLLIGIRFLDNDSRFDAVVAAFALFAAINLYLAVYDRLVTIPVLNGRGKYLVLILAFAVGLLIVPVVTRYHQLDPPAWEYLFFFNHPNTEVTWYYSYIPFLLIMALMLPALAWYKQQKNFILAQYFVLIFLLFWYIFFFSAPRRFQVRYAYYLLPYFIPLLSFSLYYCYRIAQKRFGHSARLVITALIALFAMFPPVKAVYYIATEQDGYNNRANQLAYYNKRKLIDFIAQNQIPLTRTVTTLPWILSYLSDLPYLKTEEQKKQYIFYPWDYEYLDRKPIYAVPGYLGKSDQRIILRLIEAGKVDYVIVHAIPKNIGRQYQPEYLPTRIPRLELMTAIDADKTFGFYIYRVTPKDLFNQTAARLR